MIKKALVTGSAVGIGRSIALNLANQGFDIAFHYKNSADSAQQASNEATIKGVKSIALQADITKPDEARQLVEKAVEELEGLSIVVNNVGNYLEKPLSKTFIEQWHEIINSNLNSAYYVNKAILPFLREAGWGRIINFAFASAQHTIADEQQSAYRIAKTAVVSYTKALAKELIKENITVNLVSPGVAENSIGLEEVMVLLPKKRPAKLEEICYAIDFFISPKADYITGQILEVAGGWRL